MSESLLRIGAIVLLIVGIIYPMAAMVALVRRMNHPDLPPLSSIGILLRFFLIATIPLAGILGGIGGLLPAVWESFVLRIVIIVTAIASLVGLIALPLTARWEQRLAARTGVEGKHRSESKSP